MTAAHGLLETVRVERGHALELALHQARLERSWPAFFDAPVVDLARLVRGEPREDRLCRVDFRRAESGALEVATALRPVTGVPSLVHVALAAAPRREPVAARIHKSLDRGWVERHRRPDAFETLLWTPGEGVLEGTRCNLFLLIEGELVTPPGDVGLVRGVVRDRVLELGAQQDWPLRERRLAARDLAVCSAAFLSGSGVEWVQIDRLGDRELPRDACPVWVRALEERLRHARRPGTDPQRGRRPDRERQ